MRIGIARAALPAVIVLAGNKSARAEALAILRAGGCEVRVADNVLPSVDALRVESAQAAIRGDRLVPAGPKLPVDRDYVLFAVGLLASRHPAAALALARRSLGTIG